MNDKYELTDEIKDFYGIILRRIRALRDIPRFGVKAGDLGGWLKGLHNLSQEGDAWVFEDAWVFDAAYVSGDARVCGNAKVRDNAKVYGNAWVCGNAKVCDNAKVFGNAEVSGGAELYCDAWVSGNAKVYGDALVYGDAFVYGGAWVFGNAEVSGNAKVCGNAWVSGNAKVCGDAKVSGNIDYMVFKNSWSSGRWFTYTRSNKKWAVGCFYGTGEELIRKAYADSELSGKCYEAIVRAAESIEAIKDESEVTMI